MRCTGIGIRSGIAKRLEVLLRNRIKGGNHNTSIFCDGTGRSPINWESDKGILLNTMQWMDGHLTVNNTTDRHLTLRFAFRMGATDNNTFVGGLKSIQFSQRCVVLRAPSGQPLCFVRHLPIGPILQGGWPTGNGKKLSNSQACCLAQLCLAAA